MRCNCGMESGGTAGHIRTRTSKCRFSNIMSLQLIFEQIDITGNQCTDGIQRAIQEIEQGVKRDA